MVPGEKDATVAAARRLAVDALMAAGRAVDAARTHLVKVTEGEAVLLRDQSEQGVAKVPRLPYLAPALCLHNLPFCFAPYLSLDLARRLRLLAWGVPFH